MLATSYLLQNKLKHLIFLQKQQVNESIVNPVQKDKRIVKNQVNGLFEKDINNANFIDAIFEQNDQQIRKETVL